MSESPYRRLATSFHPANLLQRATHRQLAIGSLAIGLGLAVAGLPAGRDRTAPAAAAPRAIHSPHAEAWIYLPLALRRAETADLATPAVAPPASPTVQPPTATPTPAPTDTPTPTEVPPTATASPTPTLKPGYSEPLTDFADLGDLRSGYRPDRWYPTLLEVLKRRFKNGHYVVTKLKNSETEAKFWVGSDNDTFDHLLDATNLVVHEMNHQLDAQESTFTISVQTHAYVVRDDLTLIVPLIQTFPRSEIAVYVVGPLDNFYRATYLEGRGGQEGFIMLADELNAYTQSIFVDYGLNDQFPRGQRRSARDGLVTMMMYTEFYLRHAREKHPADYAALHDKPEMRAAVELLWARAMFILDVTKDLPGLSLNAAPIEAEMRKPEMLAEIERFVRP